MPRPDTERNHAAQAITAKVLQDDGAEIDRLRALNAELLAALKALVGHFNAFLEVGDGWGNQEQAYYCLAKGAQDSWAKARAVIAKAEGRP